MAGRFLVLVVHLRHVAELFLPAREQMDDDVRAEFVSVEERLRFGSTWYGRPVRDYAAAPDL